MKRLCVKRSKNKRKSEKGKCLYKSKVEADPESENTPPCSTPLQNKHVRDNVRTVLAHAPSHLNVTASADQGSPVSAPTISQTSVKGNLTINQNFTVLVLNPSDGYPLPEDHSDVKEGTYDGYQILPSHDTEQLRASQSGSVHSKCCSTQTVFIYMSGGSQILISEFGSGYLHQLQRSHRRRHLSFKNCLEQHTLTLAEVKKDTHHFREVTVTGKILDLQPAISILQNKEGIHYSHYILYDTTAEVHLSLAEKFIVTLNQWYKFKSLSICDFGKGNVLCSTEFTTLEPCTPFVDCLQESEETIISGKVTEALLTFEYLCSCGTTLSLSNTKLFRIKCNKCRKSCRCENVQNRAKANVTIKQPNGTYKRVVLNDTLLHSIVSFKREGYCDSQQLEDRLLKAERMTVVCVDDEPRHVKIEEVEQTKDVAKK